MNINFFFTSNFQPNFLSFPGRNGFQQNPVQQLVNIIAFIEQDSISLFLPFSKCYEKNRNTVVTLAFDLKTLNSRLVIIQICVITLFPDKQRDRKERVCAADCNTHDQSRLIRNMDQQSTNSLVAAHSVVIDIVLWEGTEQTGC